MEVPSLQQLLETSALSTRAAREGAFLSDSIVTSPVCAPVLAWGSELQPCSHTGCGTAKSLHTPPPFPPTVKS